MFPPEPPVAMTTWPERRTAVKGAPYLGAAGTFSLCHMGARLVNGHNQFSNGLSTRSTTVISMALVRGSNLRPSCDCTASKTVGLVSKPG